MNHSRSKTPAPPGPSFALGDALVSGGAPVPAVEIQLKPDRANLAKRRHPWVFSGAIASLNPRTRPGSSDTLLPGIARVCDEQGGFIAWGQYNKGSRIAVRLCRWAEDEPLDQSWLVKSLLLACALRRPLLARDTNVFRLVFADADGMPGLIIDRIGSYLVVQSETATTDTWLPQILIALQQLQAQAEPCLAGVVGICERSDGDGRSQEGLSPRSRLLWGELPPPNIPIRELGLPLVCSMEGQKTGYYADQRANRAELAAWASGKDVLDVFCYSGGFSAHALRGGAHSLTLVDSSDTALELAQRTLDPLVHPYAPDPNSVPATTTTHKGDGNPTRIPKPHYLHGDAFETLRDLRRKGPEGRIAMGLPAWFDLIILDPPKLAPSKAKAAGAERAYKDLVLQALSLCEVGGLIALFSCSSAIDATTLELACAYAAHDSGKFVQTIQYLSQGFDHPVPLSFPEARYLKGLLIRVKE